MYLINITYTHCDRWTKPFHLKKSYFITTSNKFKFTIIMPKYVIN